MKKIEIIRKDLTPLWIKIVGGLIVLATLYKIVTNTFFDVGPHIYLIMNLFAVATWTAKDVVIIDEANGEIGEGIKILGFGKFEWVKYSGIEKIFINRANSAQTFRHLAGTIDIHHVNYKAFLKTNEGEKICVGISADKDELIQRLKRYNAELNTTIFDSTSGLSIEVE